MSNTPAKSFEVVLGEATEQLFTAGRLYGKEAVDADDYHRDMSMVREAILQAHTLAVEQAKIEELRTLLKEVPMPALSYEQVENRLTELRGENK